MLTFAAPFTGLFAFVLLCWLTGVFVVHVGFAAAVAQDAAALRRDNTGPLIAGPFLWVLATILFGIFAAGLYWLVNHSALSRRV